MAAKKLDAALILSRLAEMRKSIPRLEETSRRPSTDGILEDCRTAEDFEYAAVADALQSMADDLHAAVDKARAEATAAALEIYYKAEELSRDPEHADLIPHVERMREAYERQFGKPVPEKK